MKKHPKTERRVPFYELQEGDKVYGFLFDKITSNTVSRTYRKEMKLGYTPEQVLYISFTDGTETCVNQWDSYGETSVSMYFDENGFSKYSYIMSTSLAGLRDYLENTLRKEIVSKEEAIKNADYAISRAEEQLNAFNSLTK